MKLRVSTGSDTYEQPIPSASLGNNSMQIMPNTVVFNAFNTLPFGTIFTPSIVASYGSYDLGNGLSMVSTPSVLPNFVPRQIIPNLSLTNIPNKLTTDPPFSLLVSTNSDGVLTFSSSAHGVATVNSSTGQVTIVSVGTTIITVSQAASTNGQFAAATVTTSLIVSLPKGFYTITGDQGATLFNSGGILNFDSDMRPLFTNQDDDVKPITMPNSDFMFNNIAYTRLYASSNGWFYPGNVDEHPVNTFSAYPAGFPGTMLQINNVDVLAQPIEVLNYLPPPVAIFRPFGGNHISTGSYKFVSDNTLLLFKLTGYLHGDETKPFTIKVIINQTGEIITNYTFSPSFSDTTNTIIVYSRRPWTKLEYFHDMFPIV
jgi:hypothetical protein